MEISLELSEKICRDFLEFLKTDYLPEYLDAIGYEDSALSPMLHDIIMVRGILSAPIQPVGYSATYQLVPIPSILHQYAAKRKSQEGSIDAEILAIANELSQIPDGSDKLLQTYLSFSSSLIAILPEILTTEYKTLAINELESLSNYATANKTLRLIHPNEIVYRDGDYKNKIIFLNTEKFILAEHDTRKEESVEPNLHGQALLCDASGFYDGDWRNGRRHGDGKEMVDGTIFYQGQFANNMRNGHGTQIIPQKIFIGNGQEILEYDTNKGAGYYIGDWRNGERHGLGQEINHNTHITSGMFNEGTLEGIGTIITKYGKYHGECSDDLMHGIGTMQFPNNNSEYRGNWRNGLMDGEGTLTHHNKNSRIMTKIESTWKSGVLEGDATITYSRDNTIFKIVKAKFENGVRTDLEILLPEKDKAQTSGDPERFTVTPLAPPLKRRKIDKDLSLTTSASKISEDDYADHSH